MMRFCKVVSTASVVIFFIVATIIMTELILELGPLGVKDGFSVSRSFRKRTWEHWLNDGQPDIFSPPYYVYSNTGWDDLTRLKWISDRTQLPHSQLFQTLDFLIPPEFQERSKYLVKSNSLGYRSPDYPLEKSEKTKRIFVFGSYHAFGHGVENEEVYSSRLAEYLEVRNSSWQIEVWNGARQAGTAITGLARLRMEALQMEPDLIIWDFGFVDGYIWGQDNFFPSGLRFPDHGGYPVLKTLLRWTLPLLSRSRIFYSAYRFMTHYKTDFMGHYSDSMNRYLAVDKAMIQLAQENDIPVILFFQTNANSRHIKLSQPEKGIYHLLAKDVFSAIPPSENPIKINERRAFWKSEFPKDIIKMRADIFAPEAYHGSYYHLNEFGHAAIGAYLSQYILENRILDPKNN